MTRITIIGGGATGTLLAVNLIKNAAGQPVEINLVEKNGRIGRGVAYGSSNSFHLLNVPANKMGAFPDDPEHFYRWLSSGNHNFAANDFVPRRLYGEYLRWLFEKTAAEKPAGVRLNLVDAEAVDVSAADGGAEVSLDSGESIQGGKVVLAFGNFPPAHPRAEDYSFASSAKYFQDPWRADLADCIRRGEEVFVLGTGLTMVDAVLTLYYGGHRGGITAISTRGLLPAVHELGFVYPPFADELRQKTKISELLKAVRRHVAVAESNNGDWRGVVDSLRAATQELWQSLPTHEKARFMRHLRRIWDVSRHRMPPECAAVIRELRGEGRLRVLKGRIRKIEAKPGEKFEIFYDTEDGRKSTRADSIVNCTGSESDFARLDVPLVKNLLEKGYARTDPLSLGLDALPDGRLVDREGRSSDLFHTIGTALKGVLWESTAMPEIRAQARQLALTLLRRPGQTEV